MKGWRGRESESEAHKGEQQKQLPREKVVWINKRWIIYTYLEPQTTIYKWLFQLDDSQSLHRKWLFHQTSIYKWLFGVPGTYELSENTEQKHLKWGNSVFLLLHLHPSKRLP